MLRLALTPKHTLHLPPPPLLFSPALLPHAVHFAKSPLKRPTSLHCNGTFATSKDDSHVTVPQSEPEVMHKQEEVDGKFMAAMALIIGTAVGPGILGLPAATLRAGLLPSTIIIVVSWVYVITSILLIAEISFNTMQEQSVKEASYGIRQITFSSRRTDIIGVSYNDIIVSWIGVAKKLRPCLVICHGAFLTESLDLMHNFHRYLGTAFE